MFENSVCVECGLSLREIRIEGGLSGTESSENV